MPFVAEQEARNEAFTDLVELAGGMGRAPARACLVGSEAMRVVLLHWPPGFETTPHVHPYADETFVVVRGRALFSVDDAPEREVGTGEFVLARRGVRHAIRVPDDEPLLLLATVAPNEDRPDEEVDER